jgi:hypothetical protein
MHGSCTSFVNHEAKHKITHLNIYCHSPLHIPPVTQQRGEPGDLGGQTGGVELGQGDAWDY